MIIRLFFDYKSWCHHSCLVLVVWNKCTTELNVLVGTSSSIITRLFTRSPSIMSHHLIITYVLHIWNRCRFYGTSGKSKKSSSTPAILLFVIIWIYPLFNAATDSPFYLYVYQCIQVNEVLCQIFSIDLMIGRSKV